MLRAKKVNFGLRKKLNFTKIGGQNYKFKKY